MIVVCQDCILSQTRQNAVAGFGNPNAKIMIIGEAAGDSEDKSGLPFVGQSGIYLTRLLGSIGIERNEVWITNVVKCRPPYNRKPSKGEINHCSKYLETELELINPKIVVLLGLTAARYFFTVHFMEEVHGKIFVKDGHNFYITYHPSAINYSPYIQQIIEKDFQELKKYI